MNCMNQIIIEGNIKQIVCNYKSNVLYLDIKTTRFENKNKKETSCFTVECYGKMIEMNCNINQGVRIVGRLKQNKWIGSNNKECLKVVIIAEHIELKQMKKEGVK